VLLAASGDSHTGHKLNNLIPRLFILFQQPIDSASVTDGVQWTSNQQDSWCQLGPLVCSDSRILN